MKYAQELNMLSGLTEQTNILCDEKEQLTYSELILAVDNLAKFFHALPKEDFYCIGIEAKNELAHVILLLALLKTRQNFYFIRPGRNPHKLPDFCDKILKIRPCRKEDFHRLSQFLDVESNPLFSAECIEIPVRSAAVFLSTSGSSGDPKYVYFQSHKLIANARNAARRFYLASHHKILVPVPIYHMYGLGVGLLPAIIAGANVCLIDNNNIVKLLDKTRNFNPDISLLTPATCNMLLLLDKDIPRSHIYITAGAKISHQAQVKFEARYGQLINLYGCTELGAIATSGLAYTQAERLEGLVSPLPGVEMCLTPRPKGEIKARHPFGFECYLDRKGNKLSVRNSELGWYHTRDFGEEPSTGKYKILGRIDNCVNRNSMLVSLQEIEGLLEETLEEISQVVVIEQEGQNMMGQNLLAICEMKEGKVLDMNIAHKRCRSKMKKYLIPEEFIFLSKIPRLDNGKPNRNTLEKTYSSITT